MRGDADDSQMKMRSLYRTRKEGREDEMMCECLFLSFSIVGSFHREIHMALYLAGKYEAS